MRAEIISIGTELLMGEIVNTNAKYIAEKLQEVGVDLLYQTTVGDNEARIIECLDIAFSRVDIVITTGGLGPTIDDRTKEVVSKYYNKELFVRVLDKDVYPQTKWVEGSNFVDVNFKIDLRTGRVIMMGAMDNLVKGAAGQAVQNMNLMFGFDEAEGLHQIPMLP